MVAQESDQGVPPSHGSSSSYSTPRLDLHFRPSSNHQCNKFNKAAAIKKTPLPRSENLRNRDKARQNTKYNMSNSTHWQTYPQVDVRLIQIPSRFTTWDIYRLVENYGNVIKISILDGVKYNARQAFVTFS